MPFGFLVPAIVAAVIAILVRSRRNIDAAWQRAAGELGLGYRPWALFKPRLISGRLHGMEVEVDTHTRGGDSSKAVTRYRVQYPVGLGLGFEVSRAHPLARFGRFLGMQDIEVGDPVFDAGVIIKGEYPERVAAHLTPARRVVIQRLLEAHPAAVVSDGGVSVETAGAETDPEQLVSTVRRLVSAGAAIGSPSGLEAAVESRLSGDLSEAISRYQRAPADPWNLETPAQEAEALYASGRYADAAERFRQLSLRLPADPEVSAYRRRAQQREAQGSPPPAPKPEPGPSPAEVAEALFADTTFSHEAIDRFEERFQDVAVEWSGKLSRSSSYRIDHDFSDGPGTKAVVELHHMGNDRFSGRRVDAIVQLPAEAAGRLKKMRDRTVRFRGRLVRVDPLVRNIYVADGELLPD